MGLIDLSNLFISRDCMVVTEVSHTFLSLVTMVVATEGPQPFVFIISMFLFSNFNLTSNTNFKISRYLKTVLCSLNFRTMLTIMFLKQI
ncbi:hypothetical protein VIGAN_04139400 [Vigna angularis var. angularis]|uniref:Uncharacterized protein n=1 Tax=Vigna angularis var. angularis TaxID=157739 RepID=A0A0S3RU18_PHAAN|nr:hypothetical protein VIGAN_04139400 [Vigna angularis var. angularis]